MSLRDVDLFNFHHANIPKRRQHSTWTPGPIHSHAHTAHLYNGRTRWLASARAHFHSLTAQQWCLRDGFAQMAWRLGQAPVLATADNKVHTMLHTGLERLI